MADDPREQILCRHTVTEAETTFPREALPAWRAVGWLPVDEWPTGQAEPEPSTPEPSATTSTPRKRTAEATKE